MQAICIGNRGADLSKASLERSGNTKDARFNLTVGGAYSVYAMALGAAGIEILVLGDMGRPRWCHVELFEFLDSTLPPDWSFKMVDEEGRYDRALWGYRSLVQNDSHIEDLLEYKRSAFSDFLTDNDWALREGPDQEKMRRIEEALQVGRGDVNPA